MGREARGVISTSFLSTLRAVACGAMWRKTVFFNSPGQGSKFPVNRCLDLSYVVPQHGWTTVDKIGRQSATTIVASDIYENDPTTLVQPIWRNLSNEKDH